MKILMVHNIYKNRGGEEQSVEYIKTLFEKIGHTVVTYFSDNNKIESFSLWKKTFLPFRTVFSLKTFKEISEIVKKENPDFALIQNIFPLISPSVYYALKKKGVPVIQRISNYRLLCPKGLFQNRKGEICELCNKGNYLNAIIRKCYRNSITQTSVLSISLYLHRLLKTFFNKIDIFVTPSEFLKNKLITAGFPEDKFVVIHNFLSDQSKPSFSFEKYGVYMGRLATEKGLFTLLRAFQEIPDIALKIIGDGPLRAELESFRKKNNLANIEFLGFMSGLERFEILKKAMFSVIPSEQLESFPNVVIESFAVGTPVIGSQIGGISEQIMDGKNGLFFQTGNADDLREKILFLAKNPKLTIKMRYCARETFEKKYSDKAASKNIQDILSKILNLARTSGFKEMRGIK